MTTTTTKWAGRSAREIIAGGLGGDQDLYILLRAEGKDEEQALRQVCEQYGIRHEENVLQLAQRCARAEEREMERVKGSEVVSDALKPHADYYSVLRAGGRSPEAALEQVAKHLGVRHPENRRRLALQLLRVETRLPQRASGVDAGSLTRRLGELEQRKLELVETPNLCNTQAQNELVRVDVEIARVKTRLARMADARREG